MANLIGRMIAQEYALGKRENSFYQEQEYGEKIDGEYIIEHSNSTMVYYMDKTLGYLKTKEASWQE